MRHLRDDYNAIQPWPTKRPHVARTFDTDGLSRDSADRGKVEEVVGADRVLEEGIRLGYVNPIIPDDEPVFVLRAMDIVGPDAVRDWASRADAAGADHDLVQRVYDWADEMERYATEHGGPKVPDTPAEYLP